MSKYKCPSCEAIATSEQWSEATRRAYGPEIYEIDGTEKNDCNYICPNCGDDLGGEDIQEVEEG